MAKDILVTADKINKREKLKKIAKISSISIFIVLTLVFIILSVIYKGGKFVITLDYNKDLDNSLIIYENEMDRQRTRKLYAEEMPFMDNISIKWLPKDIDTEQDGSHNGQNYIAYTFYIENEGKDIVNYWYEIVVDDVIKRVDEAIRIMIFVNGDRTVYGKINSESKEPEEGTTPFYIDPENNRNNTIVLEKREKFKPKEKDRITIVVWLEGDDPDCVNAIIGGEIKMHMNIREEHYDPTRDDKEELDENEVKNENEEVKEKEPVENKEVTNEE